MDDPIPLRILYFGTYRANYARNQLLINGLRANGVAVTECHATLWRGIDDRVAQASGGWRSPRFWRRVLGAYGRLLQAYRRAPDYDVMLVGYPGQFDVYLARLLTWLRRKPLALDVLMSLHLVAEERGLTARSPFTARLLFLLEKGGLHLPDRLIAENGAYERYLVEKYNLPPARFRRVPHGANDAVYAPRPAPPPDDDRFHVLYHGTFLPSHGIPTIIRAAAELRDCPQMAFHFYGRGPERETAVALAGELTLDNVTFHGWVTQEELLDAIAAADVVLGIFGTTRQSLMTVQNKVWEALAMGRPLVSGDGPTVREALQHGRHLYLVERENPAALAAALRQLEAEPDLQARLAAGGYAHVKAEHTVAGIGRRLKQVLLELVA